MIIQYLHPLLQQPTELLKTWQDVRFIVNTNHALGSGALITIGTNGDIQCFSELLVGLNNYASLSGVLFKTA